MAPERKYVIEENYQETKCRLKALKKLENLSLKGSTLRRVN